MLLMMKVQTVIYSVKTYSNIYQLKQILHYAYNILLFHLLKMISELQVLLLRKEQFLPMMSLYVPEMEAKLLKTLGIHVPMLGLKGYSLSIPYPEKEHVVPKINVTDYGNKIVYAKLNQQLRIAAMVDIGYDKLGLRDNRISALKILLKTHSLM